MLGTATAAVPVGAGLAVLLDPLRRKSQAGQLVRVATFNDLPEDGTPKRFKIIASRSDAWTRHGESAIGAVFLVRQGPRSVVAFNVSCPHAGCAVDYMPQGPAVAVATKDKGPSYFCPCHNSSFALDGSVNDPKSPSPRGLDSLDVEIKGTEIWVRFENFQAGMKAKIPVA